MQQDSDSQAQQKIYNRSPENERNKVLQWHSQSLDLNAVVGLSAQTNNCIVVKKRGPKFIQNNNYSKC